jgi:hypothetical protein
MPKQAPVTVQLSKNSGAPQAVMFVQPNARLVDLQAALAGLYSDRNALKSVGLRFCEGCKSGLDIFIRNRFEAQIDVPGL